jgi:ComF family protein
MARFALSFDESLRRAIHHFKYGKRVSLARPLGRALALAFEEHDFRADFALPVPHHRKRERARGSHPARLLAEHLPLPVRANLVRRIRATETQTGLTRRQRSRNMRHAFECREAVPGGILIVDDVMTTGATVLELARALRRGGASRVEVLTLTRVTTATRPEGPEAAPDALR